jgi:hypothetical protein
MRAGPGGVGLQGVDAERTGQNRGESSVGIEHKNGAGVIDRVVAVGRRLDDDGDTELIRDGFDARLIGGGEADELGIEIRHVFRQLRRRIPFCIDRNEDHLRWCRALGGPQALVHRGQRRQRRRAEIRTIRIAEEHERPMAAEIRGAKIPALLIDQAKIRQCAAGREKRACGQIDGSHRVMP